MENRGLIIGCIITLALVSGCASAASIYRKAQSIDYSDGIDDLEAKYIAQNYLLEKAVSDAFLTYPEVKDNFLKPKQWEVIFQKKSPTHLSYYYLLIIDKETGKIKYFGTEKK